MTEQERAAFRSGPKVARQDGVRGLSRRMRRSISPRDKPQTFA